MMSAIESDVMSENENFNWLELINQLTYPNAEVFKTLLYEAHKIAELKELILQEPEVNQASVARIKKALANNQYKISNKHLAAKMCESLEVA